MGGRCTRTDVGTEDVGSVSSVVVEGQEYDHGGVSSQSCLVFCSAARFNLR